MIHLSTEDLVGIAGRAGYGPVRDLGMLDSAAHRPTATFLGTDAYPDLPTKAAALLHSIARNHALVDGNKRLAWRATAVFLLINEARSALTDDEVVDLVLDVAQGRCDVPAIADRLRAVQG